MSEDLIFIEKQFKELEKVTKEALDETKITIGKIEKLMDEKVFKEKKGFKEEAMKIAVSLVTDATSVCKNNVNNMKIGIEQSFLLLKRKEKEENAKKRKRDIDDNGDNKTKKRKTKKN